MGYLKIWPQIFHLLIIVERLLGVHSTYGPVSQVPGPPNLDGKNYFWKKCSPKTAGANRQKFPRKTSCQNFTVPISIYQGGIEIVWLRFAAGTRWTGKTLPLNLDQSLDTFQILIENSGVAGKVFLIREYLARGSATVDTNPSPIPPKIFEWGWISKIWSLILQNSQVRLLDFAVWGRVPPSTISENNTEKSCIPCEGARFEHFENLLDGHCKTFPNNSKPRKTDFWGVNFSETLTFDRGDGMKIMLTFVRVGKDFYSNYHPFCIFLSLKYFRNP